jgi:YesN/AraC family two-component response regulator
MLLHIKNMVCQRCIRAVENALSELNIPFRSVGLGEVELAQPLAKEQQSLLQNALLQLGFEVIDNRKGQLLEKIKTTIVELVHHEGDRPNVNFSDYLVQKIPHDYKYLSQLFSEAQGITIEKYFIAQKIERVKELLVYGELTLSEIAYKMGYSSVAHLSNQFKKTTGLTPRHFKEIKAEKRKPLDQV